MAAGRAVVMLLCVQAVLSARVERSIDTAAIQRALAVARSADAARATFHAPYIVHTGHALVTSLEVVTEYRRVVLAAEERRRFGDHLFGARDAEQMLRPWRDRVEIVGTLRFHPHNTYTRVPSYDLSVTSPGG